MVITLQHLSKVIVWAVVVVAQAFPFASRCFYGGQCLIVAANRKQWNTTEPVINVVSEEIHVCKKIFKLRLDDSSDHLVAERPALLASIRISRLDHHRQASSRDAQLTIGAHGQGRRSHLEPVTHTLQLHLVAPSMEAAVETL